MHNGKASEPSALVKEHIETTLHGIKVLHQIANNVLLGDSIRTVGLESKQLDTNIKGKGSVMECDSYWGVKLLEHGMKVVERVLERRLQNTTLTKF